MRSCSSILDGCVALDVEGGHFSVGERESLQIDPFVAFAAYRQAGSGCRHGNQFDHRSMAGQQLTPQVLYDVANSQCSILFHFEVLADNDRPEDAFTLTQEPYLAQSKICSRHPANFNSGRATSRLEFWFHNRP